MWHRNAGLEKADDRGKSFGLVSLPMSGVSLSLYLHHFRRINRKFSL